MVEQKRRFSLTNLFRRSTPKPADRTVFNMGIQEKRNPSYDEWPDYLQYC